MDCESNLTVLMNKLPEMSFIQIESVLNDHNGELQQSYIAKSDHGDGPIRGGDQVTLFSKAADKHLDVESGEVRARWSLATIPSNGKLPSGPPGHCNGAFSQERFPTGP